MFKIPIKKIELEDIKEETLEEIKLEDLGGKSKNRKYKETIKRTIIKTLLLRVIVFICISIFVIFILGEGFVESIEFALLDIFIEVVIHYIYERLWTRISWGIKESIENK